MKSTKDDNNRKLDMVRSAEWISLLLIGILLTLYSVSKISNEDDIFWHLTDGRYITQNHSVPSTDIFSFTTSGEKWIPFEWGWDVIIYTAYSAFGFTGLYVLNALFIISTYLIFYLTLRRFKVPNNLTALFILLVSFAAIERFTIRPHTVTYFFFALLLYLIVRFRYSSARNMKVLYFIPLLFLIWVNMHMGVIAGIGILSIYTAIEVLTYFRPKVFSSKDIVPLDKKELITLIIVYAVSIIALAVNPAGLNTFTYVYTHISMSGIKQVNEWAPTSIILFKGYLYVYAYILLLVLGLLTFYNGAKKKDYLPALIYLVFAVNSLRAIRYINDYLMAAFIFIAISVSYILQSKGSEGLRKFISKSIVFPVLISVISLGMIYMVESDKLYKDVLHYPRRTGVGIDSSFFPEKMVEFIKQNNIAELSDRPFNTYGFGGYFSWNFPGKMNFIDSRGVNEKIMNDYDAIFKMQNGYENLLKSYGVEYALCILQDFNPQYQYLPQYIYKYFFTNRTDWKLVYWDDRAMLFVKNIPKYSEVISKYQYKYVNAYNAFFEKEELDGALKSDMAGLKLELERKKQLEPQGKVINRIYDAYKPFLK